MQNQMFLADVLTEMKKLDGNKNPIPFDLEFRTYNNQNKSGGRLVITENATLMQAPKTPGKIRLSQNLDFKDPNHWENRTRNIKTNDGIKKIHTLFITKFNGQQVIL